MKVAFPKILNRHTGVEAAMLATNYLNLENNNNMWKSIQILEEKQTQLEGRQFETAFFDERPTVLQKGAESKF